MFLYLRVVLSVCVCVCVCDDPRLGCYQCWELRRTGGWPSSGWGTCTVSVIRSWKQTLTSPMPIIPTSPGKPQLTVSNLPHNRYSL